MLLNRLGLTDCGVEVGVERGLNARMILDSWFGEMLYLVDMWHTYEQSAWTVADVESNLHGHTGRYKTMVNTSVNAAKLFEDGSLDFVYIDADHSYQSMWDDLEAWGPKVVVIFLLKSTRVCITLHSSPAKKFTYNTRNTST